MKTYFIQAASGPVKIGKAQNVTRRFKHLCCASHELLSLLGFIEGDRERELHRCFAADRIRGEWFRASEALTGFISENASTVEPGTSDPSRGRPILVDLPLDMDDKLHDFARRAGLTVTSATRLILIRELNSIGHVAANTFVKRLPSLAVSA